MKAHTKSRMLVVLFGVLVVSGIDLGLPYVQDAQAIIGRPLTPMSYAGVARRTTRRAVLWNGASPYYSPYRAPAPYYSPYYAPYW